MHRIRTATLALALVLAVAAPAKPADLVILFPFGNNNLLTAINANTLEEAGSIDAPSAAFKVEQSIDGRRYYVISQRSTSSVVVIDSATLARVASIDLGASPSDAAMTPDGRYVLVAAANIQVVDTQTNTLRTVIQVEGAPTQIVVDENSLRAYALTSARNKIAVINLQTLNVVGTIDAPNTASIALTLNGARLLAVTTAGVRQFRTRDLFQVDTVAGNFQLINATITPIPDSPKVVVQSRGIAPNNTAQLIDLNSGIARDIGRTGQNELSKVVIVNSDRAYAIDAGTSELLELDLTTTPNATATPMPFGNNTRDISLAPNGRHLYASSLTNARLLKIDTETNEVVGSVLTSIAPSGHNLVFAPSTRPPANIVVSGGNNQFFPPNTTLPTPFTVQVTDSNGSPIPNVPVFFDDPAGIGVQIEPQQPSFTNANGKATAILTLPPPDQLNTNGGPLASLSGEGGPSQAEPEEEAIEPITITAAAPGIDPAFFTINLIRALGLIKVSGDNQVASENELFPLPMVLLATDNEGQPLPSGTEMNLAAFFASCDSLAIPLDPDGFATVRCRGRQFSPFSGALFEGGSLSATIPTYQQQLGIDLTSAAFGFSVARGGTQLRLLKLSGDGQVSQTGTDLPQPLSFRITSNFGGPPKPVQVEIDQVSGPPMLINPRRIQSRLQTENVKITVGPNAGTAVIRVRSSTPGLPELFYTVIATGGQPSELVKTGDGQVGKISNPLPTPLRLVVINESGSAIGFPEVTWRVVSGDATLAVSNDAGGSSAAVTFGQTPGTVRIVAAIGTLQANFTLTAVPPEPASISTVSGQNQTITTGLLSDPLQVRVNELDNSPAAGAVVTFSGPPSVRLHPTNGTPPGNPVQQPTNGEGLAGVRVELISVAGLAVEGPPTVAQLAQTVTVTASLGGQLATSFLLNVVGRTPGLLAQDVRNAATGEVGIVPGSLVSVYGTGLMEGVIGIEPVGGQTSYKGTQVRIGGIPVPLLAFSSGPSGEQINLQAPFQLSPGQTTTVEVENNGSRRTVSAVPVFLAQPGIFNIDLQQGATVGAVIHADNNSLVTPDNAARHGEIVSLFATGVGRLNQPVATGVLGPIPPATAALPTVVGVDNKGAPVLFSGYAPGFLGLYQVNFSIPIDARCGLRPLNLRIGDSTSPQTQIPIVCPQ